MWTLSSHLFFFLRWGVGFLSCLPRPTWTLPSSPCCRGSRQFGTKVWTCATNRLVSFQFRGRLAKQSNRVQDQGQPFDQVDFSNPLGTDLMPRFDGKKFWLPRSLVHHHWPLRLTVNCPIVIAIDVLNGGTYFNCRTLESPSILNPSNTT